MKLTVWRGMIVPVLESIWDFVSWVLVVLFLAVLVISAVGYGALKMAEHVREINAQGNADIVRWMHDNGCKRTGYVSKQHDIRAVYTCPDGVAYLGEIL